MRKTIKVKIIICKSEVRNRRNPCKLNKVLKQARFMAALLLQKLAAPVVFSSQ